MQLILAKAALVLYSAATASAFVYLYRKNEKWSLWMMRLAGAGVALHLASFGIRLEQFWLIAENRYFLPVNSFFGALSYLSMAVALVFFVIEREHRLGILGAFVLPCSVLGLGTAVLYADSAVTGLAPNLRSYWMNIHPMVLMTAYAAFGNSFGVGLALLIQENQIKSRKPSELCYRLPSIEELDKLNFRLVQAALPVLTIGILMGGIWAYKAWGRFWGWDPKETWSLITVLIYAGYLYMRFFGGLRGRKAVYVSMIGFASVIFTFFGVNLMSDLHGYLGEG